MRPVAALRSTLTIVSVAAMVGCASPEPATENAQGAQGSALADTLAGLIQQAYDFDGPDPAGSMEALYADNANVLSASGGRVTVSVDSVRAGIRTFWEQVGQNMRDPEWTWDEVHVDRLADDAAVLTGTWSIPHIAPDGQPHVIEGAWTAVFQRLGGEWKIVHEHLSSPVP